LAVHAGGGAETRRDVVFRHSAVNAQPVSPSPRYRGRFAPSPTGPLHFGSLVAAIVSYCDARAAAGHWLVRIEDVDLPRSRPDAESAILAALERYGFAWDGDILRQSERIESYEFALTRLRANGDVYECACARRELETAPVGAGGERVYPGTCRDGIPAERTGRRQRAWRVRAGDAHIEFRDRLQGPQVQELARDVGDFVVRRADGLYAYQLAVVVDDALQDITHVVRGADLLASTPRQILLQRLLGYPPVSYLHAPVAINAGGEKLSKQTRAAPLPQDALPALLAAWRFLEQPLPEGSGMPCSVAEFWSWAVAAFSPGRLPPTAMLPAPPGFESTAAGKV
jgi:glutamyl-Q tRNA(Asp) synthetase